MSRRNPHAGPRQPNEAYYTPPEGVRPLLEGLPLHAMRNYEAWEPAAGAGHVAMHLARHFPVIATDVAPGRPQVHPVLPLDFLTSQGPSGRHRLAIVTNPPYGLQNRLALAFLAHGLKIAEARRGLLALLLPFEFDAPKSRDSLAGGHPAFACKWTLGRRLRWLNLRQSDNAPMSHHAWFLWSFDSALLARLRQSPVRTL